VIALDVNTQSFGLWC